jgi:hypothetical protein
MIYNKIFLLLDSKTLYLKKGWQIGELFVDYSVLILNKNLIDNKIKNIAGCVV